MKLHTFKSCMDEIPWVSSYKYLGCVIDESLDCSKMEEHRVKLGSQVLGAWLLRCCELVEEVNGRSFLQLLLSLMPPQARRIKRDPAMGFAPLS